MDAIREFSSYRAVSGYIHQASGGLTDGQLTAVPPGLRNNILWNLGHLVVDNCEMLYRPAGIAAPHPPSFTPLFRAGSSPADWDHVPPVSEVLEVSRTLPERIEADYTASQFRDFDPALVVSGWPVANFLETLAYAMVHSGIHLGVVMTIRRLVSASGE
jgi:hypothetical protein